jgi:hypothetical protein
MAINTKKVVLGGLAAGVVLGVIDFIANKYVLGARMIAEMNAFKPGFADAMTQGNAVYIALALDFILGIALVWAYAAIRPRFGPGARTAVYAALLLWVALLVAYYQFLALGIMSSGLWWTFAFIGLVNLLLAAWVGGWLYSEDAAAV